MEYALELRQIYKRYKDHNVLCDLNMQVPVGKVYGFLGRNGAGKTTTIRIITGLVKPDAGSAFIFGQDSAEHHAAAMRNVGAIVESPAFYPNLTGTENLRISADLFDVDHSRIAEVLQIVEMAKDADRKVKTYSTGMKQRLAIANALVHSPKILILDEPTNGLDPNGVKDLRALVGALSHQLDITILVSSHILGEIQQIADTVGILHQGRLVDRFDIRELETREQSGLMLEVEQLEQAAALLEHMRIPYAVISGRKIKVQCPRAQNAQINAKMTAGGIAILNMNSVKDSLEDRFFSVVGGQIETEV
jgi:ABC-type multidrug transport system ATPase subunit